jgi:hypothetical protein
MLPPFVAAIADRGSAVQKHGPPGFLCGRMLLPPPFVAAIADRGLSVTAPRRFASGERFSD